MQSAETEADQNSVISVTFKHGSLVQMQKITNQHDFVTGEAPKLVYSTLIPLSSQLCLRIRKAMNEILSHIATVASVTVIKGKMGVRRKTSSCPGPKTDSLEGVGNKFDRGCRP